MQRRNANRSRGAAGGASIDGSTRARYGGGTVVRRVDQSSVAVAENPVSNSIRALGDNELRAAQSQALDVRYVLPQTVGGRDLMSTGTIAPGRELRSKYLNASAAVRGIPYVGVTATAQRM